MRPRNAVWEGEESLILLIFSSPTVRAITDLYCSRKARLRELALAARGRQNVGSRNLAFTFFDKGVLSDKETAQLEFLSHPKNTGNGTGCKKYKLTFIFIALV